MLTSDSISDNIRLLSENISVELNKFNKKQPHESHYSDSLVYIGNWQDAIPRSIWTNSTLDATDVRSWGVIRTQAISGTAVMLSLNRLLHDQLGYSKTTVSKVIFVLRLTRWISLCSQIRADSGQFKGNIYAIHDDPISLNEAIYLDTGYIGFVKKQTGHKSRHIKSIARDLWAKINQAIDQHEILIEDRQSTITNEKTEGQPTFSNQVHFLNLDEKHRVRKVDLADIYTTTSSSSFINKTTTTTKDSDKNSTYAREINLIYPEIFNPSEIELANLYLKRIEPEYQQKFLDETAAQIEAKRNTSKPIRNPIAYLAWLCNEQAQGNTLLTSLCIRFRENRERKIRSEQRLIEKKHEFDAMAKPNRQETKSISVPVPSKAFSTFRANVHVRPSRK